MRRAVLNRLINDEQVEQADGGYLTRLAKGQLECRTELADLATRCDVTVTEVHLSHVYTYMRHTEVVTITEVPLLACACACTTRRTPMHMTPMHIIYLQVPLFDMEVRAPPGLRAMGSAMFDADAKD